MLYILTSGNYCSSQVASLPWIMVVSSSYSILSANDHSTESSTSFIDDVGSLRKFSSWAQLGLILERIAHVVRWLCVTTFDFEIL